MAHISNNAKIDMKTGFPVECVYFLEEFPIGFPQCIFLVYSADLVWMQMCCCSIRVELHEQQGISSHWPLNCGELIAQYRPPMSFRFYPTLYLGNNLYFVPDSSWKQQKKTLISEIRQRPLN